MEIPKDLKILVVEDVEQIRKEVVRLLKVAGFFHLIEAENGLEGLKCINEQDKPFDLILSDLKMPQMDGIEFLKKVREINRYKKTPFIIVSSENNTDTVFHAIDQGVDNYIIKPFTEDMITKKIYDVLHKRA